MNPGAHVPVLYNEILSGLRPTAGGRYIDGTVGLGGHATGILEACAPDGQLLGLDRDPQALVRAQANLAQYGDRAMLVHRSYEHMALAAKAAGWGAVDGVVLDLGLSSLQLDTPERGFGFRRAGPLDMRFDPGAPLTAEEIVNAWPQEALADVIYRFGEERQSRRIASAVVAARPIRDTQHLAEVVAQAIRGQRTRMHPATRTFQALRIAVNGELEALAATLPQAIGLLRPGGRLAVIAFHSLEDRIVKEAFRQAGRALYRQPDDPSTQEEREARVRAVTRKPVRPTAREVRANPRSRSARLRIVEKR